MQKNIGKIFIRLNSNIEEPEYEFSIPESYEQSKYNYSLETYNIDYNEIHYLLIVHQNVLMKK